MNIKLKYFIFFLCVLLIMLVSSYWTWLLLIVLTVALFRIPSAIIFTFALIATAIGAVLSIPSLNIAGHILRVGLILWIVGYVLNLIELLKVKSKNAKKV